jgi:hypothetical protein
LLTLPVRLTEVSALGVISPMLPTTGPVISV